MGINGARHDYHALCVQKLISLLQDRILYARLNRLDQTVLDKDIGLDRRPVIGHKTVPDKNPFHSIPLAAEVLLQELKVNLRIKDKA